MDNRDNLGEEIKRIMEEKTNGIVLSQTTLDNIFMHRKKPIKEKVKEFLNKEIEIPIAPAIIGFAALFAIMLIPGSIFRQSTERIIDIGGSQVIVRERYEVSMK